MLTFATLALWPLGCSNTLKGDSFKDVVPPDDTGLHVDTDPPTPVDTDPPPPAPDDDGDGYDQDEDCDDNDASTHPGAPEICDGRDNDCDGITPVEEQDLDGNGVIECAESCEAPDQAPVSVLPTCEYQPNVAGTPFHARIEWSMSHAMVDPATGNAVAAYTYAEFPTYHDAMHAPVVFQATDDDGNGALGSEDMPDIAVIMGVEDGIDDGVLRLISGDGSRIHDSIHWESFTNANGTHDYAPYHYAGVAMADIDADPKVEIVTLVIRQSDGLCYPAVYEVNGALNNVWLELEHVYGGGNHTCTAHAPALADIDADGDVEVIMGRAVMDSSLNSQWVGTGGRGWYHLNQFADGYWNSGAMSFAYDMDGDGTYMEVVGGSTVYNHDGTVFCELGSYAGTTWNPALDGYPSVADVMRFTGDFEGEPEIVLTGNEFVSIYHGVPDYDPNGAARCLLIDEIPNDPAADPILAPQLPANPNCLDRPARGGPSTIADFDGNGDKEIAVAGSCWYNVYKALPNGLALYALAQTLDYSSASTGSTVFDFNGDGAAEVVFSDEEALYVWRVNTASNLQPWQRLQPLLVDENHKSWTIHEYPLVADVDNDGKAEIVSVNASNPTWADRYGIYVLGSADDDWVTARQSWPQHAFHITNTDSNGDVGYAAPNYAPYTAADYNSFRQQAPGQYGSLQAPNLYPVVSTCQDTCGEVEVYVQVGNNGPHISVDPAVVVSLYGVANGQRTLIDWMPLGLYVHPGALSAGYTFTVSNWAAFDSLVAVVDDPAFGPLGSSGQARECIENDNEYSINLSGYCQ
ncbi:MAG: VCBS repeat-containing protein [Alphaproteobacteria bacterium]|nr:VCBS repeat-containing protein [Alphaproteobacteria bacterium]